jgi:hypothetical protein
LGSELDRVPIESMVLVEARILGGDYRVLEIGRDLAEQNEFVALLSAAQYALRLQVPVTLIIVTTLPANKHAPEAEITAVLLAFVAAETVKVDL